MSTDTAHTPVPSYVEPVNAPGRNEMSVENRTDSDTATGSTRTLQWGARSDVGLVRGHNEDAFLVKAPLFAVCDGMGGHAAGEVASGIAVKTIAERAPEHADEILLGVAVEAANAAVLEGALNGTGKPGMGCTASCVLVEQNRMSVAHVGDSRVYLLHAGTLVRITHDHSYVEELVDAGEITADEARIHPSRSIITRALGSDPDMYADHFTLDVQEGDRIIICSDGLSSMVPDREIENLAMSCVTPQGAADTLVSAALTAGGHDNVTVVVIDIIDDGVADLHRAVHARNIRLWFVIALLAVVVVMGILAGILKNSWYLGNNNGTVGIYRGIPDTFMGIPLSSLDGTTSVEVDDLPDAIQQQIDDGLVVASQEAARTTVERYRSQIDEEKTRAAKAAAATQNSAGANQRGDASAAANAETGDATPSAAAQTGEQAANNAEQEAVSRATSSSVGEGSE